MSGSGTSRQLRSTLSSSRREKYIRHTDHADTDSMASAADNENEKKESDNQFHEIWSEFCQTTSVSAISRSYQSGSLARRLCWLLIFLTGLGFMTWQITVVVITYFKYPYETKLELRFAPQIRFPAITVCNLNPLRQSKIEMEDSPFNSFYKDSSYTGGEHDPIYGASGPPTSSSTANDNPTGDDPDVDDPEEEGAPVNASTTLVDGPTAPPSQGSRKKRATDDADEDEYNRWESLSANETLSESYYSTMSATVLTTLELERKVASLSDAQVNVAAHQLEDFLLDCTWAGYPCGPNNFTQFVNYKYGHCWTFNNDNKNTNLTTTTAGPMYGLVLELYVEQEEYLRDLTPEAGVKVVVHNQRAAPFPEDDGVTAPVGRKTAIGLRKLDTSRIGPPWGSCSNGDEDVFDNYPNNSYSRDTCLKSCFQTKLIATCECSDYSINRPKRDEDVPFCEEDGVEKVSCFEDVEEKFQNSELKCEEACLLPCFETKMSLTISTATWPSLNYESILKEKMSRTSSDLKQKKAQLRDDLVKLEIYIEDFNYERVEEQASYTSSSLVSNIGGQLGLWLGLSIIAVAEFVEFLFVVCTICLKCNKRSRRASKVKDTPATPPASIDYGGGGDGMMMRPPKTAHP